MNTKRLTAVALITGTMLASGAAHARDDGPRFAQDRLDALVAHHAQASRHISHGRGKPTPPERRDAPKDAS